jgi:hypothetical protein
MATRIDLEVLTSRFQAIIAANINTKLAAIATEKADSIEVKTIHASAYSIFNLSEAMMNFNPYVLIMAQIAETTGIGPASAAEVHLAALVILSLESTDTDTWKRMCRYMRALQEVVQENWRDIDLPGQLRVQTLEPRPLEEMGNEPYMGAGVLIKTMLA